MLKKVLLLLILCIGLFGCDDSYNELEFEEDFGDKYVDEITYDRVGNISGYRYGLYDICVNGEPINAMTTNEYGFIRYGDEVSDGRVKITWKIVKYTYSGFGNSTYGPSILSSHSKSVYIDSDSTIYLGVGTLRTAKKE